MAGPFRPLQPNVPMDAIEPVGEADRSAVSRAKHCEPALDMNSIEQEFRSLEAHQSVLSDAIFESL